MQAGRSYAHNLVAHLDAGAVDKPGVVHKAHAKARQIVFAGTVHIRHFGSFAAQKGTARPATAFGHAAHHGLGRIHVQLASGKIIQEKQRRRALDQNVIDAHGHQVNAYGIVLVTGKGQFELGAHAVRRGYQYRFGHAGEIRTEQPAESAYVRDDAPGLGALHQILDARNQGIARFDVDARLGIGFCAFAGHPSLLTS